MEGSPLKGQKRLRIYIAGPYTNGDSGGVNDNVRRAIEAALHVWQKGHYPFIPHLTHYVDLVAQESGTRIGWKEYLEWDRPWLELCDALLYMSPSRGADLEKAKAREAGLKIFSSVNEIPKIDEERAYPMTETLAHVEHKKQ